MKSPTFCILYIQSSKVRLQTRSHSKGREKLFTSTSRSNNWQSHAKSTHYNYLYSFTRTCPSSCGTLTCTRSRPTRTRVPRGWSSESGGRTWGRRRRSRWSWCRGRSEKSRCRAWTIQIKRSHFCLWECGGFGKFRMVFLFFFVSKKWVTAGFFLG